jgi:hypothetical protein
MTLLVNLIEERLMNKRKQDWGQQLIAVAELNGSLARIFMQELLKLSKDPEQLTSHTVKTAQQLVRNYQKVNGLKPDEGRRRLNSVGFSQVSQPSES